MLGLLRLRVVCLLVVVVVVVVQWDKGGVRVRARDKDKDRVGRGRRRVGKGSDEVYSLFFCGRECIRRVGMSLKDNDLLRSIDSTYDGGE